MPVRIIAGDWKGRKIDTPPGYDTTRPLTDRIKQSLFDRLGQFFDDEIICDICAGSGSFGFEAASRHANEVHLIEADRAVHPIIAPYPPSNLVPPTTYTFMHSHFNRRSLVFLCAILSMRIRHFPGIRTTRVPAHSLHRHYHN